MATRLGVDKQSLQQFVTDSPWSDKMVWSSIRREVIPHLEPIEAWIVDETGWLKQGSHSVGVSHQYCGAVGKQANCQVSVEVAVSDGWVAAPIAGQTVPAEELDRQPAAVRRKQGCPASLSFGPSRSWLGQLIREALGDGVAPAPVLGDAVYGDNGEFRARVAPSWEWSSFCRSIPGKHKGWDHPVQTEMKRVRRHVRHGQPPPRTLAEIVSWLESTSQSGNPAPGWLSMDKLARRAWPGGGVSCSRVWNNRRANWKKSGWWWTGRQGDPEPYHYYLAHLHRPPDQGQMFEVEPIPLAR